MPISSQAGRLHIVGRKDRTRAIVTRVLEAQDALAVAEAPASELITAAVGPYGLAPLLTALSANLSDDELDQSLAVFVPAREEFSLEHLSATRSLRALIGEIQGRWIWELVKHERISCQFQPIVSTADPGRVAAYECLMRAVDVTGELVMPERLLRAASDAGILAVLDTAAQLTAIRDASSFQLVEPIFINISPKTVVDPLYDPRAIIAAARRSGLPPQNFVFEVTEGDTLTDFVPFLKIARRFRRLGVRVALDDLGAGYASLNMLPKLRPDFVKFDMQLIRSVDEDPFKSVVLSKLIEMTRDLGIATIAEGVETEQEWEWVRDAGVTYAQGYYFARPASPPPRLDGSAPAHVLAPRSVHRMLALYLEEAHRRLVHLTEELVTTSSSDAAVASAALDELRDSLQIIEVLGQNDANRGSEVPFDSLMLGPDGTIQSQGGGVMEALGYGDKEIVGRDILDLIHPGQLHEVLTAFEKGVDGPQTSISCEAWFRHKTDGWIPIRLRGSTHARNGRLAGFRMRLEIDPSGEPTGLGGTRPAS